MFSRNEEAIDFSEIFFFTYVCVRSVEVMFRFFHLGCVC